MELGVEWELDRFMSFGLKSFFLDKVCVFLGSDYFTLHSTP